MIGVTPYAAGQVTSFDLPGYAETVLSGANTFALSYGARPSPPRAPNSGLRTDRSWALDDAILTLRGRAAWAHDFNPDRAVAATFQALPGAGFTVNGARQPAMLPCHRLGGDDMAQRLLARRHLRGRVLRCHPQLCRQGRRALRVVKEGDGAAAAVIACDKREAFAQGSVATKQSIHPRHTATWIASRSLSSVGACAPTG